jgi:hypothetical protein
MYYLGKMKIIEIETDDIQDIKTIVEILNGFIPEANADFIKCSKEQMAKKKVGKKSEKKKSQSDSVSSPAKATGTKKSKETKKKAVPEPTKKKKKKKAEESDEEIKQPDPAEADELVAEPVSDIEPEAPVENFGEIKILTADPNQVMITFIVLKASAFKKFNIVPDKYNVGLNLDELYKYIKNVDKDGTLSISIDSDDTQHIVFNVKSDNSTSHESICELRVVNLTNKKDRRIEANVSMAIRINCQAFHKACKDLLQFSQYVEITCDPTQFIITCKGDLSNHSRIFKANGLQNGIIIKTISHEPDTPQIIRLVFDLKYINNMYKCSSLCDDMEIYLNSDSVMFLKYGIKLMGEMLVGIAPCSSKKESAGNYDENDDAFYQDDDEIQLKS